ncbi:MAG: phenylalanine--tRNA ligase subunit beta [Gammaproteobacteria bacterium]
MKLSELWLREWVNPALTREQLCAQLTMAGLEVDELAPVAEEFTGIVVGKVLEVEKHPEADRLNVCLVDVGSENPLTIVCGAKNIKAGMKVPAALIGAVLPNKTEIKLTAIRGATSHGMLCSASELGLSEQGEGLLQLPHDAPIGTSVWEYLKLTDFVMDVAITPNRGDCLSVMGLSREIAALTKSSLHIPNIQSIKSTLEDTLTVTLQASTECPRYVGRIIRDVKADATTPMWMQERLRRSGSRCISPVVDVMNYVMLELGQPMHAFDLQTIANKIIVRMAKAHEELKLLDGQTVTLNEDTLIIADETKPLAMAGVMGGLDSSVTLLTKDIFIESAFFQPSAIARSARRYNLGSDSSYRFERSIDPTIQKLAIERATELLLEIVGGKPGPIIEVAHSELLPQPAKIHLRKARISKLLGLKIPDHEVETILQLLGFTVTKQGDDWDVVVPARRSDMTLEVDLIEEVMRLYGYDNLPTHQPVSGMQINPCPENKLHLANLRHALRDLGYNEIVAYSFVDKKLQQMFDPDSKPKELLNPMTADMAVMRSNLWPGLVNTLLYNQNRQQSRIRLFEIGLRFVLRNDELLQQPVISGLVSGTALPEQWGSANREIDFFDLKGDLYNMFSLTLDSDEFIFKSSQHPALHPGQTAEIYRRDRLVGIIGALHPSIIQALDIQGNVFVFELLLDELQDARIPKSKEISKFPEIRRDLAILVNRTIPSVAISDTIKEVAGKLLQDINVFDVYQGKGIAEDRKSLALSLILQDASRTLRDEEVADLMNRVIVALKDQFAAELRG